jgi:hypothetical protein
MGLVFDKQPSSRVSTNTTFTLTTAAQNTANFGAQTYQIRVATSSQACFIKVDNSAVATTTDLVWGTNLVDYVAVTPGQRASVISITAGGQVSITEMA